MKFTTRYALALVSAMGLMVAAESTQALELNGKGSSAGRNFAALTPGGLCDPGSSATFYFNNATSDPNAPSSRTEWRCTVGGVANTVFRYHGTASRDGFTSLNSTNVLLNATGYFNTQNPAPGNCTALPNLAPPNNNPREFGGHPSVTLTLCSSNTALLTNLPIHYGASDVQASSFGQTGFGEDANGTIPSINPSVDLTPLPINTVPFAIAVGGGVRQGAGPGLLDNLSISDLYQIMNGTVQNWNTIGNTVEPGANPNITVCHRTPGSGTLATLHQTIMRKGPSSINGTRVPAGTARPVAGAYSNIGNISSQNVLDCMNNATIAGVPQNVNHRVSIGYIDSDSLPLLTTGAHFVKINGFQAFDPTLPATSARLKDLRCGDYPYWANWNMVIRTNGVDGLTAPGAPVGASPVPTGTQTLLESYAARAILINPLPGFWATQADMFVSKNEDQGPHSNIAGGETFCQKAN
jgi:hypothetical protein